MRTLSDDALWEFRDFNAKVTVVTSGFAIDDLTALKVKVD